MARVITVTSGKGGVGKTNISANLAICLAEQGYRTCLFDADLGLANINILLGLYPEYDLGDVILDQKGIKDIMISDYKGVDIIPGSSGVEKIADLDSEKLAQLIETFSELDSEYDFFIFDTSAGVSKKVISFCLTSSDLILILTPEPASLTDAYALLKILSLNGFSGSVMVTVNQCGNIRNAKMVYTKFSKTVQKFLSVKLSSLGAIVHDPNIAKAVKLQEPFVTISPNSMASNGIRQMAIDLSKKRTAEIESYNFGTFWEKCLKVFKEPLKFTGPNGVEELEKFEHLVLEKKELIDGYSKEEKAQALRAVEMPSFLGQTYSPGLHEDATPLGEIRLLLEKLTDHVLSLSQDICEIKKYFENDSEKELAPQVPSEDIATNEATIIPLDFEAFLERRKFR